MARNIPKRWLPYKAIGDRIPGTRFIAFKVPLSEKVCRALPEEDRFTVGHLVGKVSGLGLVIDLTNTNRYYNSEDFRRWDIEYKKIYTVGRKVPSSVVVEKFFKIVDEFVENNPDNGKLIGVHCTHGLNRTGYLVCRYMVDKMNVNPLVAITAFNAARGHEMERQEYVDDISLPASERLVNKLVEQSTRSSGGSVNHERFHESGELISNREYESFGFDNEKNDSSFGRHHRSRQNSHLPPVRKRFANHGSNTNRDNSKFDNNYSLCRSTGYFNGHFNGPVSGPSSSGGYFPQRSEDSMDWRNGYSSTRWSVDDGRRNFCGNSTYSRFGRSSGGSGEKGGKSSVSWEYKRCKRY